LDERRNAMLCAALEAKGRVRVLRSLGGRRSIPIASFVSAAASLVSRTAEFDSEAVVDVSMGWDT